MAKTLPAFIIAVFAASSMLPFLGRGVMTVNFAGLVLGIGFVGWYWIAGRVLGIRVSFSGIPLWLIGIVLMLGSAYGYYACTDNPCIAVFME